MSNPLSDLIERRMNRRTMLQGLGAVGIVGTAAYFMARDEEVLESTFVEVKAGFDSRAHWPKRTHDCQVVIAWGDQIYLGVSPWEEGHTTAEAQSEQFGDACDFIGFMPLPKGSDSSFNGLLCVNHEFTLRETMFITHPKADTPEVAEAEMMGHGHSVVEVEREAGEWKVVLESHYNRRITVHTPVALTGPVAGHPRVQTADDPSGRLVRGILANCSGGITPWGTVLSGEENINAYFRGKPADAGSEEQNHEDMGFGRFQVWRFDVLEDRWRFDKEPNEANRFGWIVEIDPYVPGSTPKKRTALGRFMHEGAELVVDRTGRVVVYMGDDTADQFLYRFVSDGVFDPNNPEAGRDLLDHGTLYVARFDDDGVDWLPLTHSGVLAENFASQADILIECRRAGRLVGATPMDRPERVAVHPHTDGVYVMLTKNRRRTAPAPANPRVGNLYGQVLVLGVEDRNHCAERMEWSLLLEGGPRGSHAMVPQHSMTTENGLLYCPDNCAFDPKGRLWVTTDGSPNARRRGGLSPLADGLYLVDTEGELAGRSRLFLRAPLGAELTGPCFTPDGSTLFLSVQHPGRPPFKGAPRTSWPAEDETGLPARSAVVALSRKTPGSLV